MKKYRWIWIAIFAMACKKNTPEHFMEISTPQLLTREAMDQKIMQELHRNGTFEWKNQTANLIWNAMILSDGMMTIGYAPSTAFFKETQMHLVDLEQTEWAKTKTSLIALVLASEKELFPKITTDSIMPWNENVLPLLNVRVRNIQTIYRLQKRDDVRYVEPTAYEPAFGNPTRKRFEDEGQVIQSESGCGSNQPAQQLYSPRDYIVISPSSKQSWNMNAHGIPHAWQRVAGRGVKIFLIDTGVSPEQDNLSTGFSQGSSLGRMIEKKVTLPRSTFLGIPTGPVETVDDGCGHGTSMAGVCVAPRGTDGAVCGVAYQSDLISCRAAADVFLDESRETKGVADAFVMAGGRTDVKIISMSMGRVTSSSQIRDAVLYAHGKGKLIFCAAGTSLSWTSGWAGVIFPASMDQVNAITGVYESNINLSCSSCHDGPETDFTIVMEKPEPNAHPLTLADWGDYPSTVGGSSVATATAAGIAALVWSKYHTWSASMVRDKLIQSSMNYPYRNAQLGWGLMNAEKATR